MGSGLDFRSGFSEGFYGEGQAEYQATAELAAMATLAATGEHIRYVHQAQASVAVIATVAGIATTAGRADFVGVATLWSEATVVPFVPAVVHPAQGYVAATADAFGFGIGATELVATATLGTGLPLVGHATELAARAMTFGSPTLHRWGQPVVVIHY